MRQKICDNVRRANVNPKFISSYKQKCCHFLPISVHFFFIKIPNALTQTEAIPLSNWISQKSLGVDHNICFQQVAKILIS